MAQDFQQMMDAALCDVPRTSVLDEVHFEPIGEEENRQRILYECGKRPAPDTDKPRVHVGVAGGFNFDIASVTRPERILLLDINAPQEQFWKKLIGLLKECTTPEEFIDRAWDLRDEQARDGQPLRTESDSWNMYPLGAYWVKPEAYAYLHHMACDGHIATATLDIIKDAKAAQLLGRSLREAGLYVDTCYWSNIASYFEPELMSQVSTDDDVFRSKRGGVPYPERTYFEHKNDPDAHAPIRKWKGRNPRNMPLYEHMLRNISAIGAEMHSTHMLTAYGEGYPLTITDGPPRDASQRRAQWRAHYRKENGVEPTGNPEMGR
jgi:hypothetical protein